MAIFNSFLYVYQRVFRSQQGPNSGGTTLNGTGGLRQFSALRSGCRPLGVGHATVLSNQGWKTKILDASSSYPQSQSDTTSGTESWSPSSPSWQKTLRGTGPWGPFSQPSETHRASFSSSPAPRWPKPFFFKKSCRLLEHDLKVSKMEMERTPPAPLTSLLAMGKIILRLPHWSGWCPHLSFQILVHSTWCERSVNSIQYISESIYIHTHLGQNWVPCSI